MKIFKLSDVNNTQAKYLQLADTIRSAIRQGQLAAGEKLPSVKSISDDLRLNRHTVMKSLAELMAEGWIDSVQRVGYKVVASLPIETSQSHSPFQSQLFGQKDEHSPFSFRFVRSGSALPAYPTNEFEYNFSGGQPDLALFPFDEFKRCMSQVLTRPDISQLSYGQSAGTPELIEQVKGYLRQSRAITDREIVITNGSQEALFVAAQLLLKAGDKVAMEALGYPPAMSAFTNAGAQLASVKHDKQGMCPSDLEVQIDKGYIRLIYLTPLHQYPTTVTLTVSRRMAIYQLAKKHGIPIIEDDYDHEFHYRCQPLPPMASQDPAQLIIYLSTFSKVMFPGARIGVMAVSNAMAKAVEEYRLMTCHKSNVLMQAALAKWMKNGGFERHLRRTTRVNLQRRDHAVSVLKQYDCFEFDIPDGGMALWVKLKNGSTLQQGVGIKNHFLSAKELTDKAKAVGIYVQHEGMYQGQHNLSNNDSSQFIRLGFAGMSEDRFKKGIELLNSCLVS